MLVFWTAWCPVCKEEAPQFNQLAAQYEPRGVRVLGINIQDSLARTESGIKDFGIRYAVVRDADAGVARLYKVTGTPTIVFLDRQGTVRYFGNELPSDYPHDEALAWLERAYAQRRQGMVFLKVEPKWNNLRSDPRSGFAEARRTSPLARRRLPPG